ncbi:prepronociceptin isoform X2 [Bos indicus]|uniref:Prepronociceptin isoform X2 n=1 Tax=Bos indicus TaxID=9915 RepID=A0A6P5C6F7_BOSIN|nr:prepronociceptin isoform X1 [Bos taurus]
MCHRGGQGRGGLCVLGEDIYAGVADTAEPHTRRSPVTDSSQRLASSSCTMKILFCDLLLLSLFSSVSSSCQKDCLVCREKLRPTLDSFSLEMCILECEEKAFTSPLWTPCTKVMARGSWQLSPADPDHVAAALDQPRASEMQHLKRMPRVRSLFQRQKRTEPGLEEVGEIEQKQLQKRFGGFTGARKSARKLANQKRFSEFMRQYLVLSMQSSQRRRTLHQNGVRAIPKAACLQPQTCRLGIRTPPSPRH